MELSSGTHESRHDPFELSGSSRLNTRYTRLLTLAFSAKLPRNRIPKLPCAARHPINSLRVVRKGWVWDEHLKDLIGQQSVSRLDMHAHHHPLRQWRKRTPGSLAASPSMSPSSTGKSSSPLLDRENKFGQSDRLKIVPCCCQNKGT